MTVRRGIPTIMRHTIYGSSIVTGTGLVVNVYFVSQILLVSDHNLSYDQEGSFIYDFDFLL